MKRFKLDPSSKEMTEDSRGPWVKFKDAQNLKTYLQKLTAAVLNYLKNMDLIMKEKESFERGKKIAKINNAMEMINDAARYFGLGVDYRKDKR